MYLFNTHTKGNEQPPLARERRQCAVLAQSGQRLVHAPDEGVALLEEHAEFVGSIGLGASFSKGFHPFIGVRQTRLEGEYDPGFGPELEFEGEIDSTYFGVELGGDTSRLRVEIRSGDTEGILIAFRASA